MKKTKILLSSILTIMLCVSLITGATFALFTSESKVNIAITSGKVDVKAAFDSESLTMMSTLEGDGSYAALGTASFTADRTGLNIDNMAPGDYVTFNIDIVNKSTVNVKWRLEISAGDAASGFLDLLDLSFTQGETKFEFGSSLTAQVSKWSAAATEEEIASLAVRIEMPTSVKNEDVEPYEGKSQTIIVAVTAVQANAETTDPVLDSSTISITSDREMNELEEASESKPITKNVALLTDVETDEWTPLDLADGVEFDGQGHTITVNNIEDEFEIAKDPENATIKNVSMLYDADFGKKATWNEEGEKTMSYTVKSEIGLTEFANSVNGIATAGISMIMPIAEPVPATAKNYEGEIIELTHDIDLSGIENWTPIGSESNPFKGTFDGVTYTISNLTIDRQACDETSDKLGLFGVVDGGSIKNISMTDVNITGRNQVGAVIGYFSGNGELTDVTLNKVVVSSADLLTDKENNDYVLENMDKLSIGGVVGEACSNVSITVDGSKLVDVTVNPLMAYSPSKELLTVNGSHEPAQVLGNVSSTGDVASHVILTVNGILDGVTVKPILFMLDETSVHIYTAEGFIYVADNYGLKKNNYNENRPWLYQNAQTVVKELVLEADIDLTKDGLDWGKYCDSYGTEQKPMGFTRFKSSLDGKGHTITYQIEDKGFSSGTRYYGLFGELIAESSDTRIANTIKNLVLVGSITLSNSVYGVNVGSLYAKNSTVSNFTVSNIISKVDINLENYSVSGNGFGSIGGIAGSDARGTIENVLYAGTITLPEIWNDFKNWNKNIISIGGIIGSNSDNTMGSKINNALYVGSTMLAEAETTSDNFTRKAAGGIVGSNRTDMKEAEKRPVLANVYSLNSRTIGQTLNVDFAAGAEDAIESLTKDNWEEKCPKLAEANWKWSDEYNCPVPTMA